jgi:hypothetical protein
LTDEVGTLACRLVIYPCFGNASWKWIIGKPLHHTESLNAYPHNRPTTIGQLFGLNDADERANVYPAVSPSHFAATINEYRSEQSILCEAGHDERSVTGLKNLER